jgi:hypothetical protein
MPFSPLYGRRVGGVKVLKTIGGGAFGSVMGAFGRRRRYTMKTNKLRRTRLMGVMTDALCS